MKIGITLNPEKTEVLPRIKEIVNWLENKPCQIYLEEQTRRLGKNYDFVGLGDLDRNCDVIVVFGGDGTLLRVAHQLSGNEAPLLGINTGNLGFLTETAIGEAKKSLAEVLNGNFLIQKRMMLEGGVAEYGPEKLSALNDIVLARARHGRVIQVETYVDDDFVTKYVCDGLIVSTPTGSTAYNVSAWGPIVHPRQNCIILNPICPHTLSNRPLILPADSKIKLRIVSDDECVLTADGQHKITNLHRDNCALIGRSEHETSLIVPRNLSFYQILQTKLQWSGEMN